MSALITIDRVMPWVSESAKADLMRVRSQIVWLTEAAQLTVAMQARTDGNDLVLPASEQLPHVAASLNALAKFGEIA